MFDDLLTIFSGVRVEHVGRVYCKTDKHLIAFDAFNQEFLLWNTVDPLAAELVDPQSFDTLEELKCSI